MATGDKLYGRFQSNRFYDSTNTNATVDGKDTYTKQYIELGTVNSQKIIAETVVTTDILGNPTTGAGSKPTITQYNTYIDRNLTTSTITTGAWRQVMPTNVARVSWELQNTTGSTLLIARGEPGSEIVWKEVADGTTILEEYPEFVWTGSISVRSKTTASITLGTANTDPKVLASETSNT